MYHMDVFLLIQNALQQISGRAILPVGEVQDLLLDLWSALDANIAATPASSSHIKLEKSEAVEL